jgi:CheY-like chemotaxis protein
MPTKPIVMIVDDEADNRRFLSSLLTFQNYDILTASSGEDALILLESGARADCGAARFDDAGAGRF